MFECLLTVLNWQQRRRRRRSAVNVCDRRRLEKISLFSLNVKAKAKLKINSRGRKKEKKMRFNVKVWSAVSAVIVTQSRHILLLFFSCTCPYWWLSSFALLVAQRSVVVERELSCTWWRGIWEKHSLLCNERQSEIVSTKSEQSLKTPMMRRDEEINALLRPITENNFCSHFVAYRRNNFFSRLSKISAVILIHRLKLGAIT